MALALISTTSASNEATTANVTGQAWSTGDVIVALCAGNDGTAPTNANLTFTQRVQSVDALSRIASIYTAVAGSTQSTQTIALNIGSLSGYATITVLVLRGANTTTLTNTGSTANVTGTPCTVTVTGTTSGSMVFGVVETGSTGSWSPGASTTELADTALIGDSTSVTRLTGTSAGGSIVLTTTSSSGSVLYCYSALEILDGGLASVNPYTWFQPDAFQSDAFAIAGGTAGGGGGKTAAQTDNAQASDSETFFLNPKFGPQTDTARANDSFGLAIAKIVAEADTANASDSLGLSLVKGVNQSDTAQATDLFDLTLASASAGFSASQTDNAQASDQTDLAIVKNVAQSDTAQASDSTGLALVKGTAQTDTAQASDSLALGIAKNVAQTDNAQASDSLGVATVQGISQTDTAQASDSESAQKYIPSLLQSDTAQASDAFGFTLAAAGSIAVGFSDAVQAGDVEALAILKNVAQADGAVALDGFAFALGSSSKTGTVSDTARASDQFAVAKAGGGIPEFGSIHVWSGSAWVQWNGSAWV